MIRHNEYSFKFIVVFFKVDIANNIIAWNEFVFLKKPLLQWFVLQKLDPIFEFFDPTIDKLIDEKMH